MKVFIDMETDDCVFKIYPPSDPELLRGCGIRDISEEFFARYQKARAEWQSVQTDLDAILESGA